MTSFAATMDRDANRVPIQRGSFPFRTYKRITFAGGTTNAIGDDGGTNDPFTIFDVTGLINFTLVFEVITSLAGAAATLSLGTSGDADWLSGGAALTATDLDADMVGVNGSVGQGFSGPDPVSVYTNSDIIGTVDTADITAGVIDFYLLWSPVSDDGNVLPA